MASRIAAAVLAVSLLGLQCAPSPAQAENRMGYQLLSAQEASRLPRRGGVLGIDVGVAQRITDGGMTFELLRVKSVRRGSPGARAGLNVGDQIIAVDGGVFPSVAAFAAYVGSMPPGRQITIDYMPSNGGPQEAQRVAVTLAGNGGTTVQPDQHAQSTGMSTGTKVAIGAGAAALFGCYKMGCFSQGANQQPAR
jgi:predicted metalloprotease with PDZ domain